MKLIKAADKLIAAGWTQKVYARDAQGRCEIEAGAAGAEFKPTCFCAEGALYQACAQLFGGELAEGGKALGDAFEACAQAIKDHWPPLAHKWSTVALWNDRPERTLDDVRRMFGLAAGIAQAGRA